jgi:predicted DNA-binding protein with PD1-like motif
MNAYPFTRESTSLVRFTTGADLLEELTTASENVGAKAAAIEVIGSVSTLVLGFYDQDRKEYQSRSYDGAWEIASAVGNVSVLDGETSVHVHVVASGEDGGCVGGHLMPGCTVFAAEGSITALKGHAPPERELDGATGLKLWN